MSGIIKTSLAIIIVFLLFFALGAAVPLALAQFYDVSIDDWSYRERAQTVIYTADGKELARFGYKRLHQDDFPPLLKRAVVEIEDRRFYEHGSIDPRGILRALWVDLRSGEKAQGGSTITQQLARTLFLTNKKTLMRKSQEIIIATALERKYSKDAILNMYLNEIYMGRGVCGMGAAAQEYFGKDVHDLSLAEISCLVAMISAPEYYSPDHDTRALKVRQATVLKVLAERGIITKEDADRALSQELDIKPYKRKELLHPYFTVYVLSRLKQEYGEDEVYRSGLKVYTTLDSRMQEAAEKTVGRHMNKLEAEGITARDVALVSVEPGSGAVKAMVGGADFARNQINMAVTPRQPGSAIKPLIYAAAMDSGLIKSDTVLNNRPRDFNGYRPRNSTGNPAKATVRQALVNSYNVASVEVLNILGLDRAFKYLERFGITTLTPGDRHLALALGGMEKGISPTAMAGAYAVFAADGQWAQPYAIERIEDASGSVLYDQPTKTRRVIKENSAREIASILHDVVTYGTGKSARPRVWAAGKTGTTSQSRDLWFVGFTRDLSTAVWLGNSDNKAIQGVATYGGTRSGPIWRDYVNALADAGLIAGGSGKETEYDEPETGAETMPQDQAGSVPGLPESQSVQEGYPAEQQPSPAEIRPEEPSATPGQEQLPPLPEEQPTNPVPAGDTGLVLSFPAQSEDGKLEPRRYEAAKNRLINVRQYARENGETAKKQKEND